MLRRIARVLRLLLFVLGISLLAALPVTFKVTAHVRPPSSVPRCVLSLDSGAVCLFVPDNDEFFVEGFTADLGWYPDDSIGRALLPTMSRSQPYSDLNFSLPLWLLAFLCLAWPVTSSILAR